MSDRHLLDEFAISGSEQAFKDLVNRHLGLVYSTVLRQLGNPAEAEEVVQAVFCLLAEKARTISGNVLLGGWLYQAACYKCSEHRRADHRRRAREQEAAAMHELTHSHDNNRLWEKLEPMLDDAVRELDEADRQAVILRFFERKPFRDIGIELNLNDDAARKRVNRAVDKLRGWFDARGIACQADALAVVLLACCTQPAPSGMAGVVAKAALAGAAAVSLPAAAILSKSVIMTKTTLAAASAAIIALSVPSAWLWNQNRNLSNELGSLRTQLAEASAQRLEAQTSLKADDEELKRLRVQQAELLSLRNETAQLRRQAAALKNTAQPSNAPARPIENAPDQTHQVQASFKARIPSGQTFVTGGWQTQPGKRALALVSPTTVDAAGNIVDAPADNSQVVIQTILIEMPDALWNSMNLETPAPGSSASSQKNLLTPDKAKELVDQLTMVSGASLLSAPRVLTAEGRPAEVHIGDSEKGESLNLSFDPHLVSGENSYDISVGVEMTGKNLSTTSDASPPSSTNSAQSTAIQYVPVKEQ